MALGSGSDAAGMARALVLGNELIAAWGLSPRNIQGG